MKNPLPNPTDHYEYSTAEVSRFYGLTAKGLAYYEEKGLISPRREEANGYRIYTLDDCYSLYHAKLYTNAGFTLKETADLLREGSLDQILSSLEKRREQELARIKLQQRIFERISEITGMLRKYQQSGPFYEEEIRPAFYRLYVRNFNWEHISSQAQSKEFERWNEVIPVDNASLLYEPETLIHPGHVLNVNIANIVEAQDLEFLGLQATRNVSYLPPVRCVKTILYGKSSRINQIDWLTDALHYLDQNGYQLTGPVLTRMLLVTGSGGQRMRYDLAWFPIG